MILKIECVIISRFVRVYDGNRYLALLDPEKYDAIYIRVRSLISHKIRITYVIPHNFVRIKIESCYYLSLEKSLTFHNVIILIKSVLHKTKTHYYYNIL